MFIIIPGGFVSRATGSAMAIMDAVDQQMKTQSVFALRRLASLASSLIVYLCICGGCAKHPAVKGPATPIPANAQGTASFKILTSAPGKQSIDSSTFQEIIPPMPVGELKTPDYPERALKARFGNGISCLQNPRSAGKAKI